MTVETGEGRTSYTVRSEAHVRCSSNSMNPEIDVGQVEGAFVMGLGYFLTEKMEFDLETGEPKTINTWVGELRRINTNRKHILFFLLFSCSFTSLHLQRIFPLTSVWCC